jgi:hypothetical protein
MDHPHQPGVTITMGSIERPHNAFPDFVGVQCFVIGLKTDIL